MKNITKAIRSVFSSPIALATLLGMATSIAPDLVAAQVYDGAGILGGITAAETIGGVTGTDIRIIILELLLAVILFMGLAAVVVIVIAGIYMVVSVGDEQAKDKAKKIITYAFAGLVIIALAAAVVTIIVEATGGGSIFGEIPELGNEDGKDLRLIVLRILDTVLSFMGLIAVVVIVIAGIIFVVSLGEEQTKDKAKRIILYAIIGLFVIMLATAIVGFIEETVPTA